MEIIYIDSIFFLNTAVDYLLLLLAGKLAGAVLHRWRYGLAAALGGLYAAVAALPPLAWLGHLLPALTWAGVMGLAAYGDQARPWRCAGMFLALSAAFGGAVWAVSLAGGAPGAVSLRVLVLSFAVCYAAFALLFRHSGRVSSREILPVTAVFAGKSSAFRALRDTGCSLFDPMTGRGVLVAERKVVLPLLPAGAEAALEIRDPLLLLEALHALPGLRGSFRLLPYAAVGVEGGLLPVFRPDLLSVDGKPSELLLALSPTSLSPDGSYQAIVGEVQFARNGRVPAAVQQKEVLP